MNNSHRLRLPELAPSQPEDPLERQARQHLATHKFRKARDDFKVLCKRDRTKYLPLLIEANVGLVHEMLGKGQISEAQQVVAYLKTIAPAAAIQGLELQLAAKSGNTEQLVPGAITLLAQSGATLSPVERLRWADHLVTAFTPVPAQTPAETKMADEARAVHEGLDAIAAGHNQHALEVVRPLGRESVFSHWKIFIKALAAFHSGDKEKAARFFDELPPNSAPGRAREPYLLLLGSMEVGNRGWPEGMIEVIARLGGHAGLGRSLAKAQSAWLAQRRVDSYEVLRNGLPDFPREGLNALGILSEFFFNSVFESPDKARDSYEDFFLPIEIHNRARNAVELMLIRRTFCLLLSKDLSPSELKVKWEAFLRDCERLHGPNPRLMSLGYGWLGELSSESRPGLLGSSGKPQLRDAPVAIDALKKSISLDPDNLTSHLRLCAVYEAQKMMSERNRLLDSMTVRFPDRKEVLVLAGAGCLHRNACLKGLEYLEKALQLDRIDPVIPDLIVNGLGQLARQYFEKGRADQARQTLRRTEQLLIAQPENFLRNPWCHFTRCGLLEQLHGDTVQGAELLEQARVASPFPAAFLFFAQVAWRTCTNGAKGASLFNADLAAAANTHSTAAEALVLVRIWLFWQRAPDCPVMQYEEDWLRRFLNAAAAKNPFTRDEARGLVELLEPHHEFHRQAEALVKRALKQDSEDPLFRLYQHTLQPFHLSDPIRDRETLEDILDEATRRGDEKAVQMARELLAKLDRPPLPAWEREPEDFVEGPLDFPLLPMSPKDAAMMADVLSMLAGLSEKDLKWARKQRPKDMPVEVFDALIAAARNGPLPPLPSLPPMPPRQPKPISVPAPKPLPRVDPNQLDLF